MKECEECEFFNGYDYSDGTPCCDYSNDIESGYELCPYNDATNVSHNGFKIEIDTGFMHDYIRHTLENTIKNEAYAIAINEIKSIITNDLKNNILTEMRDQIKVVIENEIKTFMEQDITIGGGWGEPEKTMTRTLYLSQTIKDELEKRFKSDALKTYAENEARSAIDSFSRKLKDEVNAGVKTYFNAATRQNLTENVVSMLMCNDTYKKLSDSMQKFLPENS